VQRGDVSLSNLQIVNAILYVAENGCKWRSLPKRFGNWHTNYTRMNRWAKADSLDRLFEELQHQQLARIKIEAVSLDNTTVKMHPDGTGAQKNGVQSIGRSRGGWTTKIHMVAADARTAQTFSLTPGQAGDAPAGRELLRHLASLPKRCRVIMDRAYEGNETRQLVLDLGLTRWVPPPSTRVEPWRYCKAWYRRRNEIGRPFRRLKGFRRIFSRFDKLDVMFLAFLSFALVVEALQ
jgi:transposase